MGNQLITTGAASEDRRVRADHDAYYRGRKELKTIPDAVIKRRRKAGAQRQRDFLLFHREAAPLLKARDGLGL